MPTERAKKIRLAAIANMVLGVLAIGTVWLANDRLAAFWLAGFVGVGLILWGALDAWAALSERLRGTKLLAMFMGILGIALAGGAWFIDTSPLFRAAATIVGILVFGVSLADALVSPDEDRHRRFEPRRPQDRARPPVGP